LFAPSEAALIDFERVTFLEQELFTDVPGGRRKRLDLVARVGLKTGAEEIVLVHSEFQSRKDMDFPRRMYQYYSQLFLRHGVPIVPVAVFSDDSKWRTPVPETYELSVGTETYVRFRYHLVKLKALNYRQFLDSNRPLAFALMAKMDYSKRSRVRLKADFLRLILGARQNPARENLLVRFVETYMQLEPAEEERFQTLVDTDKTYGEVKKMVTVYEKRGIEKGIIEGKQDDLILFAEARFGKLSAARKRAVRRVQDVEKLNSLVKQIATVEDLDALDL